MHRHHRRTSLIRTAAAAVLLLSLNGAVAQESENPWARFGGYRQQIASFREANDDRALSELRREILSRETAVPVLLALPLQDPGGAEAYLERAIELTQPVAGQDETAGAFELRLAVAQQYADFLSEQGRHGQAERWLADSMSDVESNLAAWSRLPADDARHEAVASLRARRLPSLLRDAASVAVETGNAEVGLGYLDRADRLAPPASREDSFPALATRARLLAALGRDREALEVATEASAIRLDPELLSAMEALAKRRGTPFEHLLSQARTQRVAAAGELPAFRLRRADNGKEVTFADLKGKVTLVNIFFPTCGYCNAEMPELKEIEKTYADRGFHLVSVNLLPDQNEMIPGWKEKGGYRHPILVTDSRDDLIETFGLQFPGGMPVNFLVDAGGKVHFKHVGYHRGEERVIETQVREMLGLDPLAG